MYALDDCSLFSSNLLFYTLLRLKWVTESNWHGGDSILLYELLMMVVGAYFFKDFTLYFFGCFRFEQLVGKFYFLSSWHMLLLHCIVLFLMASKVKQLLWASVLLLVAMLFRLQFLPCSCLSSLVSGDLVLWLLYKFYHYNLCCRLCFFKWY